jgi:hypothetical protein
MIWRFASQQPSASSIPDRNLKPILRRVSVLRQWLRRRRRGRGSHPRRMGKWMKRIARSVDCICC